MLNIAIGRRKKKRTTDAVSFSYAIPIGRFQKWKDLGIWSVLVFAWRSGHESKHSLSSSACCGLDPSYQYSQTQQCFWRQSSWRSNSIMHMCFIVSSEDLTPSFGSRCVPAPCIPGRLCPEALPKLVVTLNPALQVDLDHFRHRVDPHEGGGEGLSDHGKRIIESQA